ncbi:hypothetical protein GIS00_12245 [Nakamurella sp. YIM 132087]|uniref:Uncharacterized protein n=1 Tax=Nakamurella alba TaxID=2665158 RepID=A0A7K1FKP0_9ACTN|nr:hypothetical protein [Nakamurella alba]MTD14711.1 hypothetical protein [Nakamurella alba]
MTSPEQTPFSWSESAAADHAYVPPAGGFAGSLPGRAVAALWVSGVYLVLSVFGIFQVLSVRDDVSSRLRSTIDMALIIGLGIMAVFIVGMILVAKRTSAVLLIVIAAVALGFSVINLGNGFNLIQVLNIGLPLAIVLLLSGAEVKDFFRREKARRHGMY